MPKPRDSQRQKLYDAENAALAGHEVWDGKIGDGSICDTTAYVRDVLNHHRTKRMFKCWANNPSRLTNMPNVRDGRGHRNATGCSYELTFPVWSRTPRVVLHEIAHCLDQRMEDWYLPNGKTNEAATKWGLDYVWHHAGHGWRFCLIYLELVRLHLGTEAHDNLKAEYKAKRVKHRPPRAMSPAAKREAAARGRRALAELRDEPNPSLVVVPDLKSKFDPLNPFVTRWYHGDEFLGHTIKAENAPGGPIETGFYAIVEQGGEFTTHDTEEDATARLWASRKESRQ